MKLELFEKAQMIQADIQFSQMHLESIDSAIKRGDKLEFIISGCGSRSINLEQKDVQPIDVDGYFNQYRANLVRKIAKLKRQFARL